MERPQGFPTIIYFENGKEKSNYDGERKKDGIVAWMKKYAASSRVACVHWSDPRVLQPSATSAKGCRRGDGRVVQRAQQHCPPQRFDVCRVHGDAAIGSRHVLRTVCVSKRCSRSPLAPPRVAHCALWTKCACAGCGHCKSMKPEYAVAANTLGDEGKEGVLVAVDATIAPAVARLHSVKSFPTIKCVGPLVVQLA